MCLSTEAGGVAPSLPPPCLGCQVCLCARRPPSVSGVFTEVVHLFVSGCNFGRVSGCCSSPLRAFRRSVRSSIPPSPWLTNRGAAFQQCPLSKHLYCGVLLTLLCQTKPRSQWNNPAGQRPSPGSFGAAGPHQNSRPDSPGSPATIAGQETNFYMCVCVSAGSALDPKSTSHAHLFTRQTHFFMMQQEV